MTWSETNVSKERVRFVLEWERRWHEGGGVANVSELCRELAAIQERSRRPRRSPTAVEDEMEDAIVAGRKEKPKWGPVKLRAWLSDRFPGVAFPSPSTIAAILERRGLVRLVKRRRRAGPVAGAAAPFPACEEPTRCGASNSRALRGAP